MIAHSVIPALSRDLPCSLLREWTGSRASTFWPAGGFTQRYGIKRLVWFEVHDTMESAILREKRIKRWPRAWKYDLIHKDNPMWRDLAEDFGFEPLLLKGKADPGSRPG